MVFAVFLETVLIFHLASFGTRWSIKLEIDMHCKIFPLRTVDIWLTDFSFNWILLQFSLIVVFSAQIDCFLFEAILWHLFILGRYFSYMKFCERSKSCLYKNFHLFYWGPGLLRNNPLSLKTCNKSPIKYFWKNR